MKTIRCTALLVFAIATLLAGCENYDDSFTTALQQRPPPPPLVWDQGNWDDVLWQ